MVNIAIFQKWITENISALEIELSKSPLKVNKYQKIYSGKLFVYTRLNHIDYKLEAVNEIERTVQQDQMTFPKENRRGKWVYYGIITACEDAKIMLKALS